MRTPLGEVRGLGSAKEGTGHFIVQRTTAAANVLLISAFIVLLVRLAGAGYEETVAVLSSPPAAVLVIAVLLSAAVHMRVGMQVIIEDYVHAEIAKFLLLAGNTVFAAAVALASVFAVLKIAFGG